MASELPPRKQKEPVTHGVASVTHLIKGTGVPNSPPPSVPQVVIDTRKLTSPSQPPAVSARASQ